MKFNWRPTAAAAASIALAGGLLVTTQAQAAVLFTMPDQAQADGPATSGTNGLWGDFGPGNGARPFVERLSVTNGGTTTDLFTNGTPTSPSPANGDLAAVVMPINLCKTGQTPAPNVCYSTPNRVQITLGRQGTNEVNFNLGNGGNQTVNADSVIDMTVKLNTLGQSLRWSYAQGDLLYWETSNLGTPDASLRIKFKPAIQPGVDWATLPAGNGCTATPIFNCEPQQAGAEYLGANLLLSLDDTLDPTLTGAVFATEGALAGFLLPGGSAAAPVLDLQVASTHFKSDGTTLNTGRLKAFLPAAALLNLYGVPPTDADTFFSATRSGSAGTNAAPTYTEWNAATHGSTGLLVNVHDITFSTPTYKVKSKRAIAKTSAKVKGKKTTLKLKKLAACKKTCSVRVYKLSDNKLSAAHKKVATTKVKNKNLTLTIPKSKLGKKKRYLVTVHKSKGSKPLVVTSLGKVK